MTSTNGSSSKSSGHGKLLAVAVMGALYWFTRKSGSAFAKDDRHSVAFADNETDAENFDQTRSAGPDGMRSNALRDWDNVDQAADESFPASDPPANY